MVRFKTFYTVIVIIFFVLLMTACTKKEEQVDVEVTVGFDNSVKVASENPISVKVTNKGKEFSGEIQFVINKNAGESIIYSKELQIAQGTTKEINMMIPFYTIQKKVEVRVTSKAKFLYKQDIAINKFISPNQPVVAVISDQPDSYRYFNSVKFNYFNEGNLSEYYNAVQTVETNVTEVIEPIMFYFDTFEEINRFENYEYFNYMVIGDNKNLAITEDIEFKLLNWIDKGNTLLFETGNDYQRLYSFLPDSIKNFEVEKIEKIDEPILTLTIPFSLAVGNPINLKGTFYYEESEKILAYYTQLGRGQVINVLVDLSEGDYKNWQFKNQIYDQIMSRGVGGTLSLAGSTNETINNMGYNLSDVLNSIPNDKQPPYIIISLLLGIYIFFVGPILYLVLKKMDKRDYMWIGIPASALVIILLLFIFGFGTRYEKPIMNSISLIDIADKEDQMSVLTWFSIFNNKSGNLTIDWSNQEKIAFSTNNNNYYYNTKGIPEIKGKLTEGSRMKYEIYDSPLWSKHDFDTSKILPLEIEEDQNFVTFRIDGEKIYVKLTNLTPLDLETSYLQWGSSLMYLGELDGYESKEFEFSTTDLFYDFYSFTSSLRSKYNLNYNSAKDIMSSNLSLWERMSYTYNNGIIPQVGIDKIIIKGINRSDIGYDIKVNESEVERFNRNIVSINTRIEFESGTELSIPPNFIMPTCMAGTSIDVLNPRYPTSNFNGNANLSIYEDTVIEFNYALPNYINIEELSLTIFPMYLEQEYYEKNGINGQMKPLENVTYEIFNETEQTFEPITQFDTPFLIDSSMYSAENGNIKIRMLLNGANENTIKFSGKIVQLPALAIEGRVK
jgi:hypothetical protein